MEAASTSLSPAPPAPARRRRRWWVYVLWFFGAGLALLVIAGISFALYWNHLVKTYTSATPVTLEGPGRNDAAWDELRAKWEPYALQFIRGGEIPPLEFSELEINQVVAQRLSRRAQSLVTLQEGVARVQFSVPLDRVGINGRFLNGVAMVRPEIRDGRAIVTVEKIEANRKPLPGWIFRRIQSVNWGERLNHRPETDLVIHGLDRVEVKPGAIILHPAAGLRR